MGTRVNLYLDREDGLHQLHPQVKLVLLAAGFLCAYLMEAPLVVLPVTAAVGTLLWWSGALENVRRLRLLFIAVPAGSFLVWCFFYGAGEPLPGVGRLGVTREGVRYAAGMSLKLETFLGASILFLSITRVEDFTAALRGFGLPARVSFAIALSFRLVPLFLASALSVVAAQQARGLDFSRGGLGERIRRYVPIIVPVFMGALRRADAMAVALEVRGFSSDKPRTLYVRSRFGGRDLAASFLIFAATAMYLWAWAHGYGRVR